MFKAFKHFLPLAILYWKRDRIFFIAYWIVHYILLRLICVCLWGMSGIPQITVMWSYHNAWLRMWCILQFYYGSWNIPSISITLIYSTFFNLGWKWQVPPCAGANALVKYWWTSWGCLHDNNVLKPHLWKCKNAVCFLISLVYGF